MKYKIIYHNNNVRDRFNVCAELHLFNKKNMKYVVKLECGIFPYITYDDEGRAHYAYMPKLIYDDELKISEDGDLVFYNTSGKSVFEFPAREQFFKHIAEIIDVKYKMLFNSTANGGKKYIICCGIDPIADNILKYCATDYTKTNIHSKHCFIL